MYGNSFNRGGGTLKKGNSDPKMEDKDYTGKLTDYPKNCSECMYGKIPEYCTNKKGLCPRGRIERRLPK